jgi:hypothetical protein
MPPGNTTDTTSTKYRLFAAAVCGDPTRKTWDLKAPLTEFTLVDSNDPTKGKTSNSVYFFNANNPTKLTTGLDAAFYELTLSSNINVASNPNLPFIGTSLGNQIYLGKFQPPKNGGVMWSGDLLMFPTKVDSTGKTVILDKAGNVASTLDATTAGWSASNNLINNHRWDARTLYTRIPGASTVSSFNYTGPAYTNATTDTPPGLKNYVATDSSAYVTLGPPLTQTAAQTSAQQSLIQLVMGANQADPLNGTNSTANRSNIMGDIVDSAPAYLEYNWDDVNSMLPSTLSGISSTVPNHFRLILVGDNQGWLHAFGETTVTNSVTDPSDSNKKINLVSGKEDELWAFMPTDFLANLDYLNATTNTHRFMVDGSPTIYFLDRPPTSGGTGNGVFDDPDVNSYSPLTDTTHERAIAIIGLRKGGRSYYALNLYNPLKPALQWSLVPDEATTASVHARNLTGLADSALSTIIQHMGYSTSSPSIGRILFNGLYKDVVFLGGGYSVPEIEAHFTGTPKLGRSVLAIDIFTGNILAAVDLTSSNIGGTSVGPVPAGVVPFEFFLGSGMTQRAYFLDMWGSLWSWGSKGVVSDSSSNYNNFRLDTSELQSWSSDGSKSSPYANTGIRKVYHDSGSTVSAGTLVGPAYTTLPSPFLVGSFPGHGYTSAGHTTAVPTAVGIAMVSGDRNDPLDYGANKPANTRLTVVFDRQDSRSWGLDSGSGPDTGISTSTQLLNAGKWGASGAISSTLAYGNASITPGSSAYYLAPSSASSTQFGYTVTFPDKLQDVAVPTTYHYSKGINTPIVVAGSLYYSYFTPATADVCTGGSGFTYSNLICDVMNPVASDVRAGIICKSGLVDTWVNVASDFTVLGTPGVQQAGTRSTTDPNGLSVTTLDTATYQGQAQSRYPKARVWRTVR